MKILSATLLTSLFIISCSDSSVQNNDTGSSTNSPAPAFIEYVWHSAEENFNGENLAMLINKWNSIIDSSPCDMEGANILTPTEKRENYDFVWVLLWPSVEARDECWTDWSDNHSSDWDKTIDGIMSYDPTNAFMFKTEPGRSPKKENTSGSFVNTFYFCEFNDGSDEGTLAQYRDDLAKIDTFSDNHWYLLLEPQFDNEIDFVWLDLWGSDADKASDNSIWGATDLPLKADEMVACDEFSNTAVVIR